MANAGIELEYEAVDGFSQRRKFYTLALAQRYAQDRVGTAPEVTFAGAVSQDGVGVLRANAMVDLIDLFPALKASAPAGRPGFGGVPVTVDEDGRDDYTGEDDLTEAAIENANDAWASRVFGGDPPNAF